MELHARHGADIHVGGGSMQDLAILSEDVNEVAHAYTSSVPCLVIISDRTLVGWSVTRAKYERWIETRQGARNSRDEKNLD